MFSMEKATFSQQQQNCEQGWDGKYATWIFSQSQDKEVYENIMVGNSRHGIEFDLKTTQMGTLPRVPIERFH